MADIELVIKIPKDYYNYIKNISDSHCTTDMLIIKNSTPLKAIEQRPKSEWQRDHEILKAYSDGASAVLDEVRAEIDGLLNDEDSNMYAHGVMDCLEIIDKFMAEGSEE